MVNALAILPLARATFDVAYAQEKLAAMLECIDGLGITSVGSRELLFDAAATRQAFESAMAQRPDFLLVLQVTFTDAAMIGEIAEKFAGALGIWAVPEPRTGGRLRLNSFCGLNLASHALGRRGREYSWLYHDPSAAGCGRALRELLAAKRMAGRIAGKAGRKPPGAPARRLAASLSGLRIGRIGAAPDGFDTCRYDSAGLAELAGIEVVELPLGRMFEAARRGDRKAAREALQGEIAAFTTGLEAVDAGQLARSLDLKLALDDIRTGESIDAFAIRCWPETFTEYGGAVCGPVALMAEKGVPCACEADVLGALTQVILQRMAKAPAFLADLVDVDSDDNTGVVWHCGQAPASMRAGEAVATVHSNRKMPLLFEFALKPGRVTFARISQAGGKLQMATAGGEMLERPKSFSGTSGVVRFDTPAGKFAEKVMASGLEHHMALVYGEHRPMLRQVAAALGMPVLEL